MNGKQQEHPLLGPATTGLMATDMLHIQVQAVLMQVQ